MRPILPQIAKTEHTCLGYVNPITVLNNQIGAMIAANQRPYYAAVASTVNGSESKDPLLSKTEATIRVGRNLNELVTKRVSDWEVRMTFEGKLEEGLILALAGENGVGKQWMQMLTSMPELYPNMGKQLEELVTSARKETRLTFVAMPSTGFARPYFDLGLMLPDGLNHGLRLPDPKSEWSRTLALLLWLFDLPRFGPTLIPDLAQAATPGHDVKSRPFGSGLALANQINRAFEIPMLYAVQGTVWYAHLVREFNQYRSELATQRDVRTKTAITARMEAEDMILRLPLHPVLRIASNMLQKGRALTYFGEADAYYIPVTDINDASVIPSEADAGLRKWTLERDLITEAINDQVTEAKSEVPWGVNPDPKKPNDVVSYGRFSRQLKSLGAIVERWSTQYAGKLGWKENNTGAASYVVQAAANYMLTDGRGYSEDPSAALAGIKPCLSVGNLRYAGRTRRSETNWNAKATSLPGKSPDGDGLVSRQTTIIYSALAVTGYQTPVDGAGVYTRVYMPAGMLMGEPDVTIRLFPSLDADPVLATAFSAYREFSSGYVRQQYGEPESNGPEFFITDWDGYGEATDRDRATKALLSGYKKFVSALEDSAIAFSSLFKHRFVVKRSIVPVAERPGGVQSEAEVMPTNGGGELIFEVFNSVGRPWALLRQDGNLGYDGDDRINASDAVIQALVDTIHDGRSISATEPSVTGVQVNVEEPKR